MSLKPLLELSNAELETAAAAARRDYAAADFIEPVREWMAARADAEMRIRACEEELERRKSRYGAAYGE